MRGSNNDNTAAWELRGKTALSKGSTVKIHALELKLSPEKSPVINIQSPFCRYYRNERVVQSPQDVLVRSENFVLKGKDYYVEIEKQKMHIDNNAVMFIKNVTQFTNPDK